MHEWALAESVVLTAAKTAEEENLGKITGVKIMLGQLQQIDADIFKFAVKELMQPLKLFEEAGIELEVEKAFMQCRNCDKKWAFEDAMKKLNSTDSESIHFVPEVSHACICCPECRSPDFEITQGRGVYIDSISVEKDGG